MVSFYQTSYKIDERAYNKADLHKQQCYGTQDLGACIVSVFI